MYVVLLYNLAVEVDSVAVFKYPSQFPSSGEWGVGTFVQKSWTSW